MLARLDSSVDAYSYVSHGKDTGEEGRPPLIVVCLEDDDLTGEVPQDPRRAFEHHSDYAYLIYPASIGTPEDLAALVQRDLEALGAL